MKKNEYWAGFSHLDEQEISTRVVRPAFGTDRFVTLFMPALYKTRREARKFHKDIRRVRITEVKPKRGKK